MNYNLGRLLPQLNVDGDGHVTIDGATTYRGSADPTSTNPSDPVVGDIFHQFTDNELFVYNGSSWSNGIGGGGSGSGQGIEEVSTLPTTFTSYPVGTQVQLTATNAGNIAGRYESTGAAWIYKTIGEDALVTGNGNYLFDYTFNGSNIAEIALTPAPGIVNVTEGTSSTVSISQFDHISVVLSDSSHVVFIKREGGRAAVTTADWLDEFDSTSYDKITQDINDIFGENSNIDFSSGTDQRVLVLQSGEWATAAYNDSGGVTNTFTSSLGIDSFTVFSNEDGTDVTTDMASDSRYRYKGILTQTNDGSTTTLSIRVVRRDLNNRIVAEYDDDAGTQDEFNNLRMDPNNDGNAITYIQEAGP